MGVKVSGMCVVNQGEEGGISTVTGTAGPDWVFVVPCFVGEDVGFYHETYR